MKIFKNPKKLNIGNTIRNFKDKITFKKCLKVLAKNASLVLLSSVLASLITTIIMQPLGAVVLTFYLSALIYVPAFLLATIYELMIRHIANKKANKEIDSIVETINQNDIDLTKEEIKDKVEVIEIENSKGFEYLDNGEYKKRKKVINYITINNNDKYKIIKEVTTYIKNVFYKKYNNKTYVIDEKDFVTEGFIDELGNVTEKGKILNLKKK